MPGAPPASFMRGLSNMRVGYRKLNSLDHHLYNFVVGLAHRRVHRGAVHVGRGGDVRVPHQVLLDAER